MPEILSRLARGTSPLFFAGLAGSARWWAMAEIFRRTGRTMLLVSPRERDIPTIIDELSYFAPEAAVWHLPATNLQSLDPFAPPPLALLHARAATLYHMTAGHPGLVVASVAALAQRTVPRRSFDAHISFWQAGDSLERDLFQNDLLARGYRRVALVEEPGQFSLRGHVIDVFPPIYELPRRLELAGDEIERIREFDVSTQRSVREAKEVFLPPVMEIIVTPETKKQAAENMKRRADLLGLPRSARAEMDAFWENGNFFALNPQYYPLFHDAGRSANPRQARSADEGFSPDARTIEGETFFDYLPHDAIIFIDDAHEVRHTWEKLFFRQIALTQAGADKGKFHLAPRDSLISGEEFEDCLNYFQVISHNLLSDSSVSGQQPRKDDFFDFHTQSLSGLKTRLNTTGGPEGIIKSLAAIIAEWQQDGYDVTILYANPEEGERLARLLALYGLHPSREYPSAPSALATIPPPASHFILQNATLRSGFIVPETRTVIVTDGDIFGPKLRRPRQKPSRERFFLTSLAEMKEGDFAVHTEHGIGIYRGLTVLTAGDRENEYLILEYREGDKLFVPVERMEVIQRYLGPEDHAPRQDKLGGATWEATRKKVKKSLQEVAEELLTLYAAREVTERKPWSRPDDAYGEFAASFEYDETPDQARAIDEVEADLDNTKPMDRLILGDAGFGKTEVAMRAAFRAVMDERQVAILVPTTILAEQHYHTFRRRMEPFPVRVEVLNRFQSRGEQKEILADLEKGLVDIIIGTHRLLTGDVAFKKLGLLIIDEEQKFGVAHKEKLKKMRTEVDVLTLSATPIPRTLHLSLIGVRDLSIISTPPQDRLPIETHICEFSEAIIGEAISSELERGGQVFFVHNRISSIYSLARLIQKKSPQARIAVIHGRLPSLEIEEIMTRFVRREADVLVCTSIIASGIDIPNANCIIINRADNFGLSQLYQMRGRVGRGNRDSRAYLLVPQGILLSGEARKRLETIMEFQQPGAGFKIAGNDLENRGAGSILGTSQSGHAKSVGYEHYVELIQNVVRELKGLPAPAEEEIKPEINLGVSVLLPADYIDDRQRRLVTYKKISLAADDQELTVIQDELRDCYGPLPEEAENLLKIISLRNRLKLIRARKMAYDGKNIHVILDATSPARNISPQTWRTAFKIPVRLEGLSLIAKPSASSPTEVLREASQLLDTIVIAKDLPDRAVSLSGKSSRQQER